MNLRILSKITSCRKIGTEEGKYTKENTYCLPVGLIFWSEVFFLYTAEFCSELRDTFCSETVEQQEFLYSSY